LFISWDFHCLSAILVLNYAKISAEHVYVQVLCKERTPNLLSKIQPSSLVHWLAILGSLVNISLPSWQRNRRTTRWNCTLLSFRIFQVISLVTLSFTDINMVDRSEWARSLRRGFAITRLLGLRVQISPCAWMFCEYCVLSGEGLWIRLISCPEESYRLWCV
jgi:hypothetical protein